MVSAQRKMAVHELLHITGSSQYRGAYRPHVSASFIECFNKMGQWVLLHLGRIKRSKRVGLASRLPVKGPLVSIPLLAPLLQIRVRVPHPRCSVRSA